VNEEETSIEKTNKEETQKAFDAFLDLSDAELDKRFKTPTWDFINKSEVRAVYDMINFKEDNPLLEVGCGTGRLILPIQDKLEITGIDFSKSFLDKLGKKTDKIKLIEADIENLPFEDNSFNSVLCVRVIQHLSKRQQQLAINELARVLAPGGSLIMLNYNRWSLLNIYKFLCQNIGNNFWPYWPLKKWNWIIDDYNSIPELTRMFHKAGVTVKNSKGAVFGEPDIIKAAMIEKPYNYMISLSIFFSGLYFATNGTFEKINISFESSVLLVSGILIFISSFYPFILNIYYWLCDKIELLLRNIPPFKYFFGRVVLRGLKNGK
tara:strand:- start:261 stop:1226 length:966 start_codon:yes stop_codon:yes gene_type:complete